MDERGFGWFGKFEVVQVHPDLHEEPPRQGLREKPSFRGRFDGLQVVRSTAWSQFERIIRAREEGVGRPREGFGEVNGSALARRKVSTYNLRHDGG